MKQFPHCQEHQESEREFLMVKDSAKLMCSQCLYYFKDNNRNVNLKDIIHLKIVQVIYIHQIENKPEEMLRIIGRHGLFAQYPQTLSQLENMQIILEKTTEKICSFRNSIENFQQDVLRKISDLKKMKAEFRLQIQEGVKLDKLLMIFSELQKNQDQYIQQIENDLFQHIQECRENSNKIFKSLEEQGIQDMNLLSKLCEDFLKQFSSLTEEIKQNFVVTNLQIQEIKSQSVLVEEDYFSNLKQIIEARLNKQITQTEKIFEGKRDGLTFNSLWNRINGKQQLLWIFKSQSHYIFGAFTPTKWTQEAVYGQDDSLSSFIFSYNLQEIYPIKHDKKKWTQYFSQKDYLIFGGTASWNQDILIEKDFQNGHSHLGVSYEAIGKDASKSSTYLFGDLKPSIMEIEVYAFA